MFGAHSDDDDNRLSPPPRLIGRNIRRKGGEQVLAPYARESSNQKIKYGLIFDSPVLPSTRISTSERSKSIIPSRESSQPLSSLYNECGGGCGNKANMTLWSNYHIHTQPLEKSYL